MGETIRVFIAIEIPPEARDELISVQATLKRSGADVKWVEPENIHLSLRFIGDVGPDKAEEIKNQLAVVASASKAFELTIKGIGAFPDLDHPGVIWAGVDRGAAESARIADDLEAKLRAIGIAGEEREFHPHITLGRVRSGRNGDKLRGLVETVGFEAGPAIKAEYLTLFMSRLTPQGSVYTALLKAKMAISRTERFA
ncbi:MAG: RNA 2',3'-cyclic phosphodiesterase [Candidatus Omnitrophica bacterium]|nr:RNA 2',3'-cyclic phosphodiesterase [Candidatus Omnitrophota bacterium]